MLLHKSAHKSALCYFIKAPKKKNKIKKACSMPQSLLFLCVYQCMCPILVLVLLRIQKNLGFEFDCAWCNNSVDWCKLTQKGEFTLAFLHDYRSEDGFANVILIIHINGRTTVLLRCELANLISIFFPT